MAFSIIFHPRAKQEWRDVIEYYNIIKEGLGYQTFDEIYTYIQDLKTFPFIYPKRNGEARACFTKRFHFGIHYFINEDLSEIWIIAIFHTKRDINTQMLLSRISDIRNRNN